MRYSILVQFNKHLLVSFCQDLEIQEQLHPKEAPKFWVCLPRYCREKQWNKYNVRVWLNKSGYVWIFMSVCPNVRVCASMSVCMCEYVNMPMCQSIANMSVCLCVRVCGSMSGNLYMQICQYVHMSVCMSMSVCPSIRVWFKPMRGHWPWGAVCTSSALPSPSWMEKLQHLAEAALRLSCPFLPT